MQKCDTVDGCCAQKRFQPEFLFEDTPEGIIPSDYDTLDFVSCGSHLYGQLLWPDGRFPEKRPCVILLHGFPGAARNDDIAQALCRAGCVVIVPHLRGAWGSEGKYLVSHCVEDAINLANYARSPEFTAKYHTDPNCIFLGGHSMGGNNTLAAARHLPWLRGLFLLAPFDPTRNLRNGEIEFFDTLMKESRLLHCDGPDAIREDILAHMQDFAFEEAFDALKDQNICCLEGSLDDLASEAKMVAPLWEKLEAHDTRAIQRLIRYPLYHGLLGMRMTIIRDLASFMADVMNA